MGTTPRAPAPLCSRPGVLFGRHTPTCPGHVCATLGPGSLCFLSFSNYSTPLSKLGGHFLEGLEACRWPRPVSGQSCLFPPADLGQSHCTLLGSFLIRAMTNTPRHDGAFSLQHKACAFDPGKAYWLLCIRAAQEGRWLSVPLAGTQPVAHHSTPSLYKPQACKEAT